MSKWAERFSRKFACSAYPESLREIEVLGIGGNTVDTGETFGEGGEFEKVLTVEDVEGRSLPRL